MSEETTPEQNLVIDIIANQLLVGVSRVVPTAHLRNDLGADSLDEIELMMCFEDAFNTNITDKEGATFITVQNIFDYITEKNLKVS